MPIYLQDFELGSELPDAYSRAVIKMASDIGTEPVNPATAMQLIRGHLRPLLAEDKQDLLDIQGQPSWKKIQFLFPKLAFASNQGADKDLVAAATVIDNLVRFTTRPPRQMAFPKFIEIVSFTRVCGYLHVPVALPQLRVQDAVVQLFDFCKFCWLPALSRGVCQFHSTGAARSVPAGGQPICAAVPLKTSQRLLPAFEKQLLALTGAEELAFHDSDFALQILLPSSGLRQWLAERRPRLAALVGSAREFPDTSALSDLLAALYGHRDVDVATSIGSAMHLLTPVTLRAEAWLKAWYEKPAWGGARRRRDE